MYTLQITKHFNLYSRHSQCGPHQYQQSDLKTSQMCEFISLFQTYWIKCWGWGRQLCFNKSSRWLWCMFKFEIISMYFSNLIFRTEEREAPGNLSNMLKVTQLENYRTGTRTQLSTSSLECARVLLEIPGRVPAAGWPSFSALAQDSESSVATVWKNQWSSPAHFSFLPPPPYLTSCPDLVQQVHSQQHFPSSLLSPPSHSPSLRLWYIPGLSGGKVEIQWV